jgi:hypothetical protein
MSCSRQKWFDDIANPAGAAYTPEANGKTLACDRYAIAEAVQSVPLHTVLARVSG